MVIELERGAGVLVSSGLPNVVVNNRELKGFVKETGEAKKGELEGMEPQLFTNPFSHTVHSEEMYIVIASLCDIMWEAQCDEEVRLLPQELWKICRQYLLFTEVVIIFVGKRNCGDFIQIFLRFLELKKTKNTNWLNLEKNLFKIPLFLCLAI